MKHTPGPWAIGGELISHNDIEIATVMHCYADKTGKPINRNSPVLGAADANARLIAAAPELLEGLEKLLQGSCSIVAHYHPGVNSIIGKPVYDGIDKARAAIARAEGK